VVAFGHPALGVAHDRAGRPPGLAKSILRIHHIWSLDMVPRDEVNHRILRCTNTMLAGMNDLDGESRLTALSLAYARVIFEEKPDASEDEFNKGLLSSLTILARSIIKRPSEMYDAVLESREDKSHLI